MDLSHLEASYLAYHVEKHHSPRTVSRYKETFADFHKFLNVEGLTADTEILISGTFYRFGAWLTATPIKPWRGRTERSIHTIHGGLRDMKAFCKWLVGEEVLEKVPKIDLPKLPDEMFEILTEGQILQLFTCPLLTGKGGQAIRNRVMIAFFLDTGARLSEVSGLTMKDLDALEGTAKVKDKGNRDRLVYFEPAAQTLMQAWIAERGSHEGEIFELSPRGIQMLFKRIRDETGLPVHPHLLRHQAATEMLRNTGDVYHVKRMLGHRQLSTTEKYLSLAGGDVKAKHAVASPYEKVAAMLQPEPERRRRRLTID